MNILITGGSGFIGQRVCEHFNHSGNQLYVLSRQPKKVTPTLASTIHLSDDLNRFNNIPFDIVINLAGAPILGKRWNEKRKQQLIDSRTGLTQRLVTWLSQQTQLPSTYIGASAIGFYGEQGQSIVTEDSKPTEGFTHQLCHSWEKAAEPLQQQGVRVCHLRLGVVLHPSGGMLKQVLTPFRFGLGGRLGSGEQWFSWIHLSDVINIIERLSQDSSMSGPYNATSPNPVTNKEFTRILGASLNRPTPFPVPAWLLHTLLGEQSELLLGSQRVIPDRLNKAEFQFSSPYIKDAIS